MSEEPSPDPVEPGTATTTESASTTVPPPAEPSREEWATRYKYLYADFENYRRRTERERENLSRQVRGAMIREMLPILEAFRTGKEAATQLPADHPLRRGLELLDREWATFLKHEGVEPVAQVGTPFRPDEEVAVGEAPVATKTPDGSVAEIVQQGYRFFGGLVRPAKVIVARAPVAEATAAAEAQGSSE
jgi:molecular chaperone GrpE